MAVIEMWLLQGSGCYREVAVVGRWPFMKVITLCVIMYFYLLEMTHIMPIII